MIQVKICDDDPVFRIEVSDLLRQAHIPSPFEIRYYHSGGELLQAIAEGDSPDLLLLDIEMPYVDGIKTASHIRQNNEYMVILYVTRLKQYVFEGYRVNAFGYVLKPLDETRFLSEFHRALLETVRRKREFFCLDRKGGIGNCPYGKSSCWKHTGTR